MQKEIVRMFVYGTLKSGQPSHRVLEGATKGFSKFIGKAQTVNKYPLVIASRYNVPFLLKVKGTGKYYQHVRGEVFEMDTDILAMVDALEHHPDLYERHQVDVKFDEDSRANSGSDDVISCWCYFLVKYKPYLLNLQLFENYDCNIGDKAEQYVRPSDQPADEKFSHWHEVHIDY